MAVPVGTKASGALTPLRPVGFEYATGQAPVCDWATGLVEPAAMAAAATIAHIQTRLRDISVFRLQTHHEAGAGSGPGLLHLLAVRAHGVPLGPELLRALALGHPRL